MVTKDSRTSSAVLASGKPSTTAGSGALGVAENDGVVKQDVGLQGKVDDPG